VSCIMLLLVVQTVFMDGPSSFGVIIGMSIN
jgi:hypothetical protein